MKTLEHSVTRRPITPRNAPSGTGRVRTPQRSCVLEDQMPHHPWTLRLIVTISIFALSSITLAGMTSASARPDISISSRGTGLHVTNAARGKRLIRRPHVEGPARSVADYTSRNWAGYFATTASHAADFTAVSAQWTQPAVICNHK